ncbi:MAG: SDR family oxidoreductase [Candidatus Obscuribacterales bacterium]|nr:SDR family oxidoreductase [Candidatus Obscuribacterales bacterium]
MSDRAMKKGVRGIITGASTGIGKAMALQLARDYNASLLMNARGREELEAAAQEVRAAGGQAVTVVGDVSAAELSEQLLSVAKRDFGGLDFLVNNAGLARSGPMTALNLEDWRYVFEVNFFAALKLSYAVMPVFAEQKHGKIVNIASVAGKVAFPGSVCYAASKFALTGLSEGMAAEYSGKIDVITVCPGWVRTEFFKKNNTAEDPSILAQEASLKGWLMKNVLSISSEQAAHEIVGAMKKGGSHELVLTAPGVIVERMAGYFPELTQYLSSLLPSDRRPRKAD